MSNLTTGLTARPNRVLYTSRWGSISTRFLVISAVSLDTLSDRFTGDAHVVNVSPKPLFIISKSWTLCTDLTNLPELVFTSTVRIKPSLPGKTCVMMPSGHCRRGRWSASTSTTDPSLKVCPWDTPLQGGRFRRYSELQTIQNLSTTDCLKSNLWRASSAVSMGAGSDLSLR